MASRGSPNVLEPIPLNQLHDAPNPPLKKRKLSASNNHANDSIIIRVCSRRATKDGTNTLLGPCRVFIRRTLRTQADRGDTTIPIPL